MATVKQTKTKPKPVTKPDTPKASVAPVVQEDTTNPTSVQTQISAPKPKAPIPAGKGKETIEQKIERYKKRYPSQDIFHATTDGNVFFNEALAQTHQLTIGDGKGEIKTFTHNG